MEHEIDHGTTGGCLECLQLQEAFRKTALELQRLHDEHDSCGRVRGEPERAPDSASRGEAGSPECEARWGADGEVACRRSPGIKDIAYIHKEAELYEANNKARRAFNDHREKVHEGMAYA